MAQAVLGAAEEVSGVARRWDSGGKPGSEAAFRVGPPAAKQALKIGGRNTGRRFGTGMSRTHKRRIDQMLDQEPRLQLIGSDHVGDDEIICSVIS